jgi:hypothetical protein
MSTVILGVFDHTTTSESDGGLGVWWSQAVVPDQRPPCTCTTLGSQPIALIDGFLLHSVKGSRTLAMEARQGSRMREWRAHEEVRKGAIGRDSNGYRSLIEEWDWSRRHKRLIIVVILSLHATTASTASTAATAATSVGATGSDRHVGKPAGVDST